VLEERVGRYRFRACPFVELAQTEGERHEGDGQERQRVDARLDDAPDDEPPGTPGQIMDLHDRQAAERYAEPEEVGDEIGAEERRRAEDGPDGAGAEGDDADEETALAEACAHSPASRSSGPRAAAGTSLSVACWLRWRARM